MPASNTPTREHYIPLRKTDLVRALADDARLVAEDRRQFLQLCQLLEATFHHEYHARLDDLKDTYAPFDPDADTVRRELSAADRERSADALFDKFVELLQRANYVRLTREQLLAALQRLPEMRKQVRAMQRIVDRLDQNAAHKDAA